MKTGRKTTGWSRRHIARLAYDTAGNTMLILAAAMFPIIGMAGSAFDMGRAYMVKSRLQQACDAGALAGRRAMTTSTFDTAAKAEADKFFAFNYPDGSFGTTANSFTPTGTSDGQVTATATATVPMTLMKIFSVPEMALTVNCEAKLEVANTDIMFVLDVTGSMNCAIGDGSSCTNNGNVEKETSKIKALRAAVLDFYDTLDAAVSSDDTQLRFGFVPYSSAINMGSLLSAGYVVDTHKYQSRIANFETPYYDPTSSAPSFSNETYGSSISKSNCDSYGINNYPSSGSNPITSGTAPNNTTTTTYSYYSWTKTSGSGWSAVGTCVRKKSVTITSYTTKYKFTNWIYQQEEVDTSGFKAGNSVPVVTALSTSSSSPSLVPAAGTYDLVELAAMSGTSNITTSTYSWNGCIEERNTIAQATFPSIPSGAYDLDIDLTPSSNETRWRPSWPALMYSRSSSSNGSKINSHYCPKTARKLSTMTRDAVYNYLYASDFVAIGSTYHDIGMIWGGRLISPDGIFASENSTALNGRPISRHVVFMTDGDMAPTTTVYSTYGYENLDQRVSGGDTSSLTSRHNERFSAVCSAIKAKNITIWVVAYGTSMNSYLAGCADSGKAFYSSSDAQLKEQFKLIASKIADLRLAK